MRKSTVSQPTNLLVRAVRGTQLDAIFIEVHSGRAFKVRKQPRRKRRLEAVPLVGREFMNRRRIRRSKACAKDLAEYG
jgi:hypothetical protein